MAPYEGDIADVNVNQLEFTKFAEDTIDENGVWGTVRMMDDTNGTWTATVPADIKPGNYVIRQEVRSEILDLGSHSSSLPMFYLTLYRSSPSILLYIPSPDSKWFQWVLSST